MRGGDTILGDQHQLGQLQLDQLQQDQLQLDHHQLEQLQLVPSESLHDILQQETLSRGEYLEHIAYSIFACENFFFTVLYRVFHMIWMNKIFAPFSRALKKGQKHLVYQLLELPPLNHMKQPVFSERERIKLS